ncbi:MAG: MiaB/RimO family radical SAM methylthiotransferase [Bacillota bacterium]|nr:MiaB/RimO family radical SAM methylthiotransferase [Bacillota bacterium]
MDKSFAVFNFGCKVNQEEGGAIAALFAERGWTEDKAAPRLLIVNTCTVTNVADKKARAQIRRLRREHPDSVLAVCGCYAQRAPQELAAIAGVDIVAGVAERAQLPQLAEQALAGAGRQSAVGDIAAVTEFADIFSVSRQSRARAYLKIEDGCGQFCHYCIVPYVRGPVRSLPLAQAVDKARQLARSHGEIVLSGIHIGAYGEDLPALIDALCALPELHRLRLGSIEPQQFTPQLLRQLERQPKLCRHLHIPLQAGCDATLAAMGRRYTTAQYAELLARLRAWDADIAVSSDIIAGYPGESEDEHAQTLAFVRQCAFALAHVFPYSRRAGTRAAALPCQLSAALKAERAARISAVCAETERAYVERFIGRKLELLTEQPVNIDGCDYISGHSGNYLPLLLPLPDGELRAAYEVVGERACGHGLIVRPSGA